jgi:DUF1365 family protein
MRSHLLEGIVRHRRAGPVPYSLEHEVWYLAVDLDELDELDGVARPGWLLRRNGRAVVEVRDSDHWPEPATDLRQTVHAHLRTIGVDPAGWQITLVTCPRVFGYVFNPASFYLCRDPEGELRVVVVEVHNTHLERHLYTLRQADPGPRFRASMDKDFYVSPFIDMQGTYTVHVADEPGRLRIAINERRGDTPVIATGLVLRRRRLTSRMLVRMLVRHPFMPQRTIALIHLHAWRLWRRGARFQRHSVAIAEDAARRAGDHRAAA